MIRSVIPIMFFWMLFAIPLGAIEMPEYKVIWSKNVIEKRKYSPMIVAEVRVAGERRAAIHLGFRPLADYIFGNNTVRQDDDPTASIRQSVSQKIPMTVPVLQQEVSEGLWRINFVMPSQYTMETLPQPNNDSVVLKRIFSKTFLVIRFSGVPSHENLARHKNELWEYIQRNNLRVVAPVQYAFYDPPWTPPQMRRNEIMFEIADLPLYS